MKVCPFCGFQLRDGVNFCSQCGKDIRIVAPSQPEKPQDTSPSRQEDAIPEPGEAPPAEKGLAGEGPLPASGGETGETGAAGGMSRRQRPKWRLPAVLCVIALIAGGVFLWRGGSGNQSKSVSEVANSVLYLEVFDEDDTLIGTASGFLVGDQSTLVTNYHVARKADHIAAWTADMAHSAYVGSILTCDEVADLAVLHCDSTVKAEPLTLGDSGTVRQGDKIYAVGYPLGLANTLSDGIVSSRYLDMDDNDIIQVTAAISGGNSGGPLLDTNGRVIGVMCAYYVDGQNLNIAIASDTLKSLLASGFHEVSLKDWGDRPEMPGYEPEDAGEDAPGVVEEDPVFQPMNPDWTEAMKSGVDPCFHGTWDYHMVDDFEEQNEIELAGTSSCSIDLNHGVMVILYNGELNNRQFFSSTDQKNTICEYYENEYCITVTTYVLISDNTIQATYVLTHKEDGSQSLQYFIYEKTSDLAYDSGAYM